MWQEKKKINWFTQKLNSTQMMVVGFAALILLGSLLLCLPISSKSGESTNFLNALFTATSAVCVTGLVVVDTATYWSEFGHFVIISLIQIGGLGFMTIGTMFALIARKKINLRERLLIQESLNQVDLSGLVRLTRQIILMAFMIEAVGALVLCIDFIPRFGLPKGVWYSIFHSISAFCNAGFDLMGSITGQYSSLTAYPDNIIIMTVISILIVLGGIGFPVIIDVIKNKKISRLNVNSKLVIFTTAILILIGFFFMLIAEYNNPKTLGSLSGSGKFIAAMFQSITLRTAGFNSVDLSLMKDSTILLMLILMFIGASPASTGGGIKTTTLATLFLTVKGFILGSEDIQVFGRRISGITVRKSLGIFFIGISIVSVGTLALAIVNPGFTLVENGFEVISAFATVGLSIGSSPNLTWAGKIIIIILMFLGRVGTLTIFMALVSKGTRKKSVIKYPEGKIIVG